MQLPLTSLIPSVIEIISFWKENLNHLWWYPYWYLGVPTRFLLGPIIPLLIITLSKFIPLSIQFLYILLVIFTWLVGGVGVGFLSRILGGSKQQAFLGIVLFWMLPFALLLLSYGSGLAHIVVAVLPWVWISYIYALKKWHLLPVICCTFLLTAILLIDISGLLPAGIGIIILSFQQPGDLHIDSLIKSILLLITAFALSTIWYTPRYWWVVLFNPSFAGKPLINVIGFIIQLAQSLIPVIFGLWVVQKRYKLSSKLINFSILFGSSFLFLTLIRFASDPDFIIDWTNYLLELQLALALLLPVVISRRYAFRTITFRFISFIIILILTIGDGWLVRVNFFDNIAQEYRHSLIAAISSQVSPHERIFFTGSPVFWWNGLAPYPFIQVRGDADSVATHPSWAMGSFQIREGNQAQLVKEWLTIFGVSKLLVQGVGSPEYFKDFRHFDRFVGFNKISQLGNDVLFDTPGDLARIADKGVLTLPQPSGGNDSEALTNYIKNLGPALFFNYINPTHIQISGDVPYGKIISMAITFDSNWRVVDSNGRIMRDSFGSMVLEPKDLSKSNWSLVYQDSWISWVGVIVSIVCILLLWKVDSFHNFLKKKSSILAETSKNEEELY